MLSISVIIPTKGRLDDLLNALHAVYLQKHLPDELIIIDQNHDTEVKDAVISQFDLLNESVKSEIKMKYILDAGIPGLTHARNRGVDLSESEVVLFLEDDVIPERDFISNMLDIFEKHKDVHGVGGIVTNINSDLMGGIQHKYFMIGNLSDRRVAIYTDQKLRTHEYIETTKLSGGLTGYRKEVFEKFRFDEDFINYALGEDFDFSFRVSREFKLVITPGSRLVHVMSDSGRHDHAKIVESSLYFLYHFFRKNLESNLYNYFCFFWLNIGFFFSASAMMLLRLDFSEARGIIRAYKKIINKESSDFYIYNIGK